MSVLTLYVDEVMRTLSNDGQYPFVVNDKTVDIVRFALNTGFTDVVLDEYTALRVMYQRPGESQVRAQTLTYYDTDGLHNYYDWQLLSADLTEKGTLTVALCILRTDGEVEEWHTTPCQVRVLDSIHTDDSDEGDESITPSVAERVAILEAMTQRLYSMAGGAPIVVSSVSDMTDTDKLYVLTTDNNWYYYNGTTWVAGGEYGAVATDVTLSQSGIPADAKAVGDALAEAMTGEALEDGESMKYVLSSKYDDFKLVDGYGYFDAEQLLNFGYGGPKPYQRGSNNVIFRMGYGDRSWLSPNYLTDGLFSPDFPIEDIPWAGPAAVADASFMGSLPEGFYITIPNNPVRRGNRFLTIPISIYGNSASLGDFVAGFLDGSIGVKIDTDNLMELDLDEKFLTITAGTGYSTVTIEGTRFYKGQLNTPTTMSEFLGYTDNQANRYRTFCTFGLPYEYSYAKECMWFASGFNQSRILYRVKADDVDGENTAVNIVNYLINKRHVKFYYMQEVTE